MENNENIKYQMAAKRVKDLKSFYTHLFVYLAVNLLLFFLNSIISSHILYKGTMLLISDNKDEINGYLALLALEE